MLFNSFEFLLFFPVVTVLYFILPHKVRWLLLLIASCYFYMFFYPPYILILGGTIVIDYFAGIFIERTNNAVGKRNLLVVSLVANIGILFFFKYFNFFNDNLTCLLHGIGQKNVIPFMRILLPIGLSFHTFQAMSYTIEVYRGNQKAEKHFGIYALYVMFYPQLVAGPIERPQNMLHQFHERHYFNYDKVVSGIVQIVWGIFKKAVIADSLALFVDPILNDPGKNSGLSVLLAVIFFGFQIFCDFSGYSDVALGSARVMGFDLMVNFRRPYSSRNITEFWSRWHISLSTWFRDYLYIPLGGNRVAKWKWYRNIFIVFLVSGLWHGANWTFVIWGAMHGTAMVIEAFTSSWRKKIATKIPSFLNNFFGKFYSFSFVAFAWIFFRAKNTKLAFDIIRKLPGAFADILRIVKHPRLLMNNSILSVDAGQIVFYIVLLLILESIHRIEKEKHIYELIALKPAIVRWSLYFIFVFLIYYCGVFNNREFIYFQF